MISETDIKDYADNQHPQPQPAANLNVGNKFKLPFTDATFEVTWIDEDGIIFQYENDSITGSFELPLLVNVFIKGE